MPYIEAVQLNPDLLASLKSLAAMNPKLQRLLVLLGAQQGAAETPAQTVSSNTPANPNPSATDLLAIAPSQNESQTPVSVLSTDNASQSNT